VDSLLERSKVTVADVRPQSLQNAKHHFVPGTHIAAEQRLPHRHRKIHSVARSRWRVSDDARMHAADDSTEPLLVFDAEVSSEDCVHVLQRRLRIHSGRKGS
jgi:hypothetical protein